MLQLYIECSVIGLIGLALQTALKIKSFQEKATASNIDFNLGMYFKYDWYTPVTSILTLLLLLFFLKDGVQNYSPVWIKLSFGTAGYIGADIPSRLFSTVNKRLNNVIDIKTNISDTVQPDAAPPITEKITTKSNL